jgi:hypothetical protein
MVLYVAGGGFLMPPSRKQKTMVQRLAEAIELRGHDGRAQTCTGTPVSRRLRSTFAARNTLI